MNDQMRIVGGSVLGAVIGGVAAYLLMTEDGRGRLRHVGPAVDDLSRVLQDLRSTISKLSDVAVEGRHSADRVRAAFTGNAFSDAVDQWQ